MWFRAILFSILNASLLLAGAQNNSQPVPQSMPVDQNQSPQVSGMGSQSAQQPRSPIEQRQKPSIALSEEAIVKAPSGTRRRGKKPKIDNGIVVGPPKIYDDHSLQLLLNTAVARLSQLNAFDQATLIGKLGTLQGANASQTQLALQASGNPLPGVTTKNTINQPNTVTTAETQATLKAQATAPDTTTDNKTVTNSPTQTTETNIQNATVSPNVPNLPSGFGITLPSSFSVSSLTLLNEETQLSSEIINLQLLLQGAISDDWEENTLLRKHRTTFGFPISISTPLGHQYKDAVAEVELSICNPAGSFHLRDLPSAVVILPKERTYNVASITSKSASVGAAAVTGVLSVGGNFLRGHQTYYVVKDQDTISLQRLPTATCTYPRAGTTSIVTPSTTIAWQFRPVLGHSTVEDGERQTFAQFAFSPSERNGCSGPLLIRTGWRRYDVKSGLTGDWIETPQDAAIPAKSYDFAPRPEEVDVDDNGDGTLTVRVLGKFVSGVRVRIGNSILDDSSAGFERGLTYIRFTAPAFNLASYGAKLISSDGSETEVAPVNTSDLTDVDCNEPIPVPVRNYTPARYGFLNPQPNTESQPQTNSAKESTVTPKPFSDSTSIVEVPIEKTSTGGAIPDVQAVIVGSRVFGFRDAPFLSSTDSSVSIVVPNDLLKAAEKVTWIRLFESKKQAKTYYLTEHQDSVVTSITLVSSGDPTVFAIFGRGLSNAKVLIPDNKSNVLADGTMMRVEVKKADASLTKNIVIQIGNETPIVLALPTGAPPDNKPSIDKHPPIAFGDKSLTVTGSGLDGIVDVHFLEKPLFFALAADKKSLTVQLPDGFAAAPGIEVLEFIYNDKSSIRYEVPIQASKRR